MLSSDVERQESVEEEIVTRDLEMDDRGVQELRGAEDPEDAGMEPSVPEIGRDAGEPGDPDEEDAVAKELATNAMERRGRPETNSSYPWSIGEVGARSSHSVRCWKIRRPR